MAVHEQPTVATIITEVAGLQVDTARVRVNLQRTTHLRQGPERVRQEIQIDALRALEGHLVRFRRRLAASA